MCGIVGIVGDGNVVPEIVEGLRRLEYRGYDSAGVAVVGAGRSLARVRAAGKIARLEEELKATEVKLQTIADACQRAGRHCEPGDGEFILAGE